MTSLELLNHYTSAVRTGNYKETDRGVSYGEVCFELEGGEQSLVVFVDGAEELDAFCLALRQVFGVAELSALDGVACHVLRSFPGLNEPIEGVETLDGGRFTRTAFLRSIGHEVPSPLQLRRKKLIEEMQYHAQKQQEAVDAFLALEDCYVSWG